MIEQIKLEIEQISASSELREFHARSSRGSGLIEIKGKKVHDFTNWDLFALNENKQILHAVQAEVERFGIGAGSSRLQSGTTLHHLNCEKRISQFLGVESALLFSTKNQAVFSLLHALAGESDVVFFDEHIQSPVADAVLLVKALAVPFNTSNLESFELELPKYRGARRRFVFCEAISPLTGRLADLSRLFILAKKFDLNIVLDESFSLFSQGLRGAGVVEEGAKAQSVFCIYASLSHTIPYFGAFISGNALLTNLLIQKSRTFQNEISLPPIILNAIERSIDYVEFAQSDRLKIEAMTTRLREGLGSVGFIDALQGSSPIVCILVGKGSKAIEWAEILLQKGFLVDPVSVVSGPTDVGLIRMLVGLNHSVEVIDRLVASISDIVNRMGED